MFPTFRYHPTLAPEGKKFTDEDAFAALSDDWVDTPTKFPPPPEPEPQPEPAPKPRRIKREDV